MPTGFVRVHLLQKCVADREAEGLQVRALQHLALTQRSSQSFDRTGVTSADLHLRRETDIRLHALLWKHRFENFLKDTQHLHRKRCQRNGSNTLAAKCFALPKRRTRLRLPIYIAAFSTRPYPQQLTCTRADLGLNEQWPCSLVHRDEATHAAAGIRSAGTHRIRPAR